MSQRCWLDAAICMQNFLLQNGTFRVLVYERSGEPNMSKKKGKPCFMEDIYLKHERLMYYIAGKYSEVSVQREDIVQTAVLSLLKNEATLQRLPPYAQINYIAAAVRNTAINTIKRDQKEAARCIPLDDLTEDFPQAHIPGAEVRYLEK